MHKESSKEACAFISYKLVPEQTALHELFSGNTVGSLVHQEEELFKKHWELRLIVRPKTNIYVEQGIG